MAQPPNTFFKVSLISVLSLREMFKKKCLFCQVGWNLAHFYRVSFESKKNVFKFLCPCLDKLEFIVRYTRLKVLLNLYTRHNHCPQNFLPSLGSLHKLCLHLGVGRWSGNASFYYRKSAKVHGQKLPKKGNKRSSDFINLGTQHKYKWYTFGTWLICYKSV